MKYIFIIVLCVLILSCGDDNPINDNNKINIKTGDAIVAGIITDDNGNPISGAEIDIEGNRTITDSYGEFKIDNAAEGEVTLKISSPNHIDLKKEINTVEDEGTYIPYTLADIENKLELEPGTNQSIKLNDLTINVAANNIYDFNGNSITEATLEVSNFGKSTIELPENYDTPEEFGDMFNPAASMKIEITDKNGNDAEIEGSISLKIDDAKLAEKFGAAEELNFFVINDDIKEYNASGDIVLNSSSTVVIAGKNYWKMEKIEVVDLQDDPIANTPISSSEQLGWTGITNEKGELSKFPHDSLYIYYNEKGIKQIPYAKVRFPINKSLEARYTLEDFNITSTLYSVDMFFLNENEIFVFTGDLYYSSNRGESWEKRKSNINNPDYQLIQMYFKDNMNGIANFDGIQTTTDGGYTWEKLDQFKGIQVMFFEVFEDNSGILITKDKERYRTKDRGMNWTKLNKKVSLDYFNPKQIEFINEKLGYGSFYAFLGGGRSYVKLTTDGGVNWEPVPLQGGGDLSAFFAGFVDETAGYLSTNRELRKTIDGGQTWNVIDGNEDYTHSADIDITLNDQPALTTWDMDYLHNYKIEDDTLKFLDKFSYQHKLKISASVCWTFSLDAENKWYYTGAHLIRRRGAE